MLPPPQQLRKRGHRMDRRTRPPVQLPLRAESQAARLLGGATVSPGDQRASRGAGLVQRHQPMHGPAETDPDHLVTLLAYLHRSAGQRLNRRLLQPHRIELGVARLRLQQRVPALEVATTVASAATATALVPWCRSPAQQPGPLRAGSLSLRTVSSWARKVSTDSVPNRRIDQISTPDGTHGS